MTHLGAGVETCVGYPRPTPQRSVRRPPGVGAVVNRQRPHIKSNYGKFDALTLNRFPLFLLPLFRPRLLGRGRFLDAGTHPAA